MKRPQTTSPSSADPLDIPDFLKRADRSPRRDTSPDRPRPADRHRLPPDSMMPVLRAINRGKDTMQKLRGSLGHKYADKELRDGLQALLRIRSIHKIGRRYRPIQSLIPPSRERKS